MDLEELFMQAMDAVEAYMDAQKALNAAFKEGFIELAASRYAVGMERVSLSQFPARMRASKRVIIDESESSERNTGIKFHLLSANDDNLTPSKTSSSPPAISQDDDTYKSDLLAELASKYVDLDKKYEGSREAGPPPDPLQWFGGGAAAPVSLTKAQQHFCAATELILELANARQQLATALAAYLEQIQENKIVLTRGEEFTKRLSAF